MKVRELIKQLLDEDMGAEVVFAAKKNITMENLVVDGISVDSDDGIVILVP